MSIKIAKNTVGITKYLDVFCGNLFKFSASITLIVLFGIIVSLFIGAWPAIHEFGLGFIISSNWNPVQNEFGALPMIYGTLVTSIIALIIAVPISFGIAIFLTELAPSWLREILGTVIELLAAIPSIVFGMWGLFVLSPYIADYIQIPIQEFVGENSFLSWMFEGPPLGIGLLPAGIILAIMIIPFIATVMRDVFLVTPSMLKESSYALGSTTWEVMRYIVLPYTKVGVVGGIVLGLGRALGETMAVTFIIGNMNQIDKSLFAVGTSITATLANEFAEADSDLYVASLMYLGLILFFITFSVLILSKILMIKVKK